MTPTSVFAACAPRRGNRFSTNSYRSLASRASISRSLPSAFITPSSKPRGARSRAVAFMLPRFPQDSPPVFLPSRNAWRKFGARWKPAPTNSTLPVSLVLTRAIREYAQETAMAVGFKPAGGIRTAKQSLDWLALMKEELGDSWLKAELFRFGASGMLADIERQLEHHATGRYSAEYRHPIA